MEDELPGDFHAKVRAGLLDLAAADPGRYLVVDASGASEAIATGAPSGRGVGSAMTVWDALVGQRDAVDRLQRAVVDAGMAEPVPR